MNHATGEKREIPAQSCWILQTGECNGIFQTESKRISATKSKGWTHGNAMAWTDAAEKRGDKTIRRYGTGTEGISESAKRTPTGVWRYWLYKESSTLPDRWNCWVTTADGHYFMMFSPLGKLWTDGSDSKRQRWWNDLRLVPTTIGCGIFGKSGWCWNELIACEQFRNHCWTQKWVSQVAKSNVSNYESSGQTVTY